MGQKKGFTLMELLVSIFISGMVMLSLVAMWKTSSNHTAQAQRQSIIKNDNTIFLRKFYTDFVMADDIVCPWGFSDTDPCTTYDGQFFAINHAKVDTSDLSKIKRTTGPVCGGNFTDNTNLSNISNRCLKPSYIVYTVRDNAVYRCSKVFLDQNVNSVSISDFLSDAKTYCDEEENNELIMPYIQYSSITIPVEGGIIYPESLKLEYAVRRDFAGDIPPVYFKFQRYFVR